MEQNIEQERMSRTIVIRVTDNFVTIFGQAFDLGSRSISGLCNIFYRNRL